MNVHHFLVYIYKKYLKVFLLLRLYKFHIIQCQKLQEIYLYFYLRYMNNNHIVFLHRLFLKNRKYIRRLEL